jgi:hypothetical protein
MKYIKTYEGLKFKVGDYVVVKEMSNRDLIIRGISSDDIETDYSGRELIVKLIENPSIWKDGVKKDLKMKLMDRLDKRNRKYTGELPDSSIIRLYENDIIRRMTPKEIEDFKMKFDANNYNL